MTSKGLITLTTKQSVDEVVTRLKRLLAEKQVKLFAVVDHSGEAEAAGMAMPNTKLLIFGSPKAGTPLMLASPSAAIDLPLKILVAQGADGQTTISYNSVSYLRTRHGFPEDLELNIQAVVAIAQAAAAG